MISSCNNDRQRATELLILLLLLLMTLLLILFTTDTVTKVRKNIAQLAVMLAFGDLSNRTSAELLVTHNENMSILCYMFR